MISEGQLQRCLANSISIWGRNLCIPSKSGPTRIGKTQSCVSKIPMELEQSDLVWCSRWWDQCLITNCYSALSLLWVDGGLPTVGSAYFLQLPIALPCPLSHFRLINQGDFLSFQVFARVDNIALSQMASTAMVWFSEEQRGFLCSMPFQDANISWAHPSHTCPENFIVGIYRK